MLIINFKSMKRDKSSILAIALIVLIIIIIGFISILEYFDSSIFHFLYTYFRYLPMIISFGVMLGSGVMTYLFTKSNKIQNTFFPFDEENSIFFWFFWFLFWGWIFLNILIPFVYLYDIKPIGPQEKFHYVDSSIPQILELNQSIPLTYSLYFLAALPFVLIIAFFLEIIFKLFRKEIIKSNVTEDKINSNSKFYHLIEEFSICILIFEFVYYCTNFTYPTIVFLLNK